MPELPQDKTYFEVAPDWICEVLSPSTAALDRGDKRRIYAVEGVTYLWFVDPDARFLEVFELDQSTCRLLDVFAGEQGVRAVPFEAIELDLGALWAR